MRKILSVVLSFGLLFQQSGLVYAVGELNLVNYLSHARGAIVQPDRFRPAQLRYISYDIKSNDFKLLLDKGDFLKGSPGHQVTRSQEKEDKITQETTQELTRYFFIGLTLPNDKFWVNLRPDAADSIIDPLLEKTDIGKIFLESDLQLKKDTASRTSPQTTEGKIYWDKLYKKAGELFGTENITIPTITRPWIVPNEVIVRETDDSAYIYKATLKVMLEEDYLTSRGGSRTAPTSDQYTFSDPRLKELNQYSTQLIRETILPKLTQEVNSSKKYAKLRQVYYSLVLSRWFKMKYKGKPGQYPELIDRQNLTNLASKQAWDKQTYFSQYQESFAKGEYNLKETVASVFGQSIRSYVSGGIVASSITFAGINTKENSEVKEALTGQPPATTASPLTLKQGQGLFLGLINEINSILKPQGVSYSGVDEKITLAKNLESLLELIPGVSIQLDSFIDNAPGNAKIGLQEIRGKFKNFIKLVSTAASPLTEEQEKLINEIKVATSGREFKSVPAEILYRIESIIEEIEGVEVKIKAKDRAKPIKDLIELDSLYWVEFFALLEKYSGVELVETAEDIEKKLTESVNEFVEDLRRRMSDENGEEFEGLLKLICRVGIEDLLKKVIWGVPMGKINEIKKSINEDEIVAATFQLQEVFLGQKGYYKNACNLIRNAWRSVTAGSPLTGVSSAIGSEVIVPGVKRGGIDLTDRMLNMQIERVGSFASSALVLPEINNVEALDLDKEFEQIQAMVSSSIRPSDTRILEFAVACYYKGEFDRRLTQVSSCVKSAHLADERLGKDSSDTLRLATMLPDALYGG